MKKEKKNTVSGEGGSQASVESNGHRVLMLRLDMH
jgi:hypothetical protein